MFNIPEYTAVPKPPRTILKFARFGYNFELFFAWFDFWIGVFYDRKKKTVYLALLPMLVLSLCKIRPVIITEIKMSRRISFQNPFEDNQLDEYIKNNPQFLDKIKKDMQRVMDDQNRRLWRNEKL